MKKLVLTVLCGAVAVTFSIRPASARPAYNTEFKAKYIKEDGTEAEKKLAKAYKEAGCATCHGKEDKGKDKKIRNVYGKAKGELLGKDQKDKEKIKKALEDAEAKKAKDDDKQTFGEKIKEGKLPADD